MPRYVDHAARRDHVAQSAAELVAVHGLEGLTVRRVADAAGFSTTVVSHYFTDRRDLVLTTYRAAAARSSARLDAAIAGGPNPLKDALEALLPVDDDRRRDWRVWVAFWAMATADPEMAAEQALRVRSARARLECVIKQQRDAGELSPNLDVAATARRLLVLVHGIGTQAVFDAPYWSPARQRAAVTAELAALPPGEAA